MKESRTTSLLGFGPEGLDRCSQPPRPLARIRMNRELVEERSLTTEGRDLVIIDRCEVSADLMGAITEPLSSFYARPPSRSAPNRAEKDLLCRARCGVGGPGAPGAVPVRRTSKTHTRRGRRVRELAHRRLNHHVWPRMCGGPAHTRPYTSSAESYRHRRVRAHALSVRLVVGSRLGHGGTQFCRVFERGVECGLVGTPLTRRSPRVGIQRLPLCATHRLVYTRSEPLRIVLMPR